MRIPDCHSVRILHEAAYGRFLSGRRTPLYSVRFGVGSNTTINYGTTGVFVTAPRSAVELTLFLARMVTLDQPDTEWDRTETSAYSILDYPRLICRRLDYAYTLFHQFWYGTISPHWMRLEIQFWDYSRLHIHVKVKNCFWLTAMKTGVQTVLFWKKDS